MTGVQTCALPISVGWKNLTFHQPEIGRNVCPFGFTDDDGMTDWVQTVFVGPGEEGGEIEVMDLFSFLDRVIQFDGIGASTKERVSGFEPGNEFKGIDELTHGFVLLLDSFPFAFPHDHDAVTCGEQSVFLASGGFLDVTHGLVTHLVTRLVTVRKTFGTSVPETTIEFVHGAGPFVVPVHVEGLVPAQDHVFPSVASMTNVDVRFSVEVGEPFQSSQRMGFPLCMPSSDGFGRQRTFLHVFGAVEEVASGGDGDASFQGVETTDLFEFFAEDLTGSFQEEDIRFAIGHELRLEVKDVVGIMTVVPGVKLSGSVGRHALGIVVFLVG